MWGANRREEREGGMHFLCKKMRSKGFLNTSALYRAEGGEPLRSSQWNKDTCAHTDMAAFARINELGWSSQGVRSYYAHCAVGQLKLFGCFFWSYIYQSGAGGLALHASALLCPHCRTHVCIEIAFRYPDSNTLNDLIQEKKPNRFYATVSHCPPFKKCNTEMIVSNRVKSKCLGKITI